MSMEPFSSTVGKTALSAVAKPALAVLRRQIARRGAGLADLSQLSGADRELDEAIAVLRGKAESLPATVVLKLKGLLSQRPDSFADADARHFIDDDRVIALVKSGARKTFGNVDIADERIQARAIHAEMFGEEGIFGERLIEDAVQFAALTLLAHLTPGDRIVIEFIGEKQDELLQELHHISSQIADLKQWDGRGSPTVDISVLDQALTGEVRRLRRQRFIHGNDLVSRAQDLAARLENGLQLASVQVKATAYREIAVVHTRADLPDAAEHWIDKAEALGSDVILERARVALARGQPDEAMRLLRDRDDPVAKSLLIDAVQRRDGESAALKLYEDRFKGVDLTGHALQSMAVRLSNASRSVDAEALLARATPEQIDDNPVILYLRARLYIAGALPDDIAERFRKSDGMIPRPSDVRDDDEGQRRLAAARVDLVQLRDALSDLDAADLIGLVDVNMLFLSLHLGTPTERALARESLVTRLADPSEAVELAPIAAIHGVDIDWSSLRARLAQAEQLGGYDDAQLRAAFALVMKGDSAKEIADFIVKYGERLKEHQDFETIVAIEIEARSKSGDIEGAKALLARERAMLADATAAFLDATIAEAEGADSIGLRIAQYEASGSTHDLQILVGVLGQAGDDRLGDYLIELWQRRHQIEDAQRACDALIRAGKEHAAEAFLEEIGDLARQDNHLRTHLAWGRLRQGRLLDAADELKALTEAGIDNHNTRQLTIVLAIETGRWAELEPFLQKELAAQADRSGTELMTVARIGRAIDSPTTMALVRAAIAKAPDDPMLNMNGYTIAVEAGFERTAEVNGWFGRVIAGSTEDGPIYSKDFEDVVEMVKDSRAHSERVNELVNTAQVPIFLALEQLRGAQSALILLQAPQNAEETDSRRKSVLPLFAGNRPQASDLIPKSIAFDPLALLMLDYLGLLQCAIDAFDEVVLPAGTLHSFFEDRARSGPSQPSRIAQAREIKDRAASGTLTVEALPIADAELAERTGEEFARLYATAVERDGYVIETAPLHPPGKLRETVDPAPFAGRLVSPTGLVQSLLAAGTLSQARATSAAAMVAGSGQAWPNEAEPLAGKPMFLTGLAAQYLSDAGLLPVLKSHAGALVVLPDVIELADREIAAGEASEKVRLGIERVREALADAIAQGRARIGPTRLRRDKLEGDKEEQQVPRNMGPVVSALRDSGGVDAFVCDDRAMNKYLQFTDHQGRQVPFLTTPDLLRILHDKGVLDAAALTAAREKLRLAGAGLMPLDPLELVAAAQASNWAIGPNAELRAIRDSIHLPLARKILQLPQERSWFKATCIGIAFAIRRIWQELDDPVMAERAATYLLNMIPDAETWSAQDESPDRGLWVQDVFRHTLWAVASIFDMPTARTQAFQQWFNTEVGPGAERRDPGAMEAIARTLFGFLTTPLSEDDSNDGR